MNHIGFVGCAHIHTPGFVKAIWERNGSGFDACLDQFKSGQAMGSKYYPRIVTNILWMKK